MDANQDSLKTRLAKALAESPYLTTPLAAYYVRLSARTLETMRSRGGGPTFRYHGKNRNAVYHFHDLDVWSAARCQRTNKEDLEQLELPLDDPNPKGSSPSGNGRADH